MKLPRSGMVGMRPGADRTSIVAWVRWWHPVTLWYLARQLLQSKRFRFWRAK